jgi:two-component system, OmpR family, response regulator MprA
VEIDGPIFPESALESAPPIESQDRRGRVLVVDDDPDMRSLLEDTLRDEGYLVGVAADTLSALILLLGQEVDVLVLDWKMPDLDGFVLLETVRRISPKLPVIFITAHNHSEIQRRALECGAFGFLAKPFPVRLLLAEIQGALVDLSRRDPVPAEPRS